MILFFDTETTGFPKAGLVAAHPDQPHVVQLAALLTERDGSEAGSLSVMIRPDGWTVPDAASSIHGITSEVATKCGVRARTAAVLFADLLSRADLLVAHNIQFDLQLVGTMFARHGKTDPIMIKTYCTMTSATPIVNLPATERMVAAGFNKPKSPKLSECVDYFFGEKLEGAHDAMVDVRACARLYFHLRALAARETSTLQEHGAVV